MKQILIFITTALFLTGCGSNGSISHSSGDATPPTSPDVDMVISQPYTVYPGDKVIKGSDTASLKISHTDFHDESTVVLIEGNATIIRQQKN